MLYLTEITPILFLKGYNPWSIKGIHSHFGNYFLLHSLRNSLGFTKSATCTILCGLVVSWGQVCYKTLSNSWWGQILSKENNLYASKPCLSYTIFIVFFNKIYQAILQRNSLHVLLRAFSLSHMENTFGQKSQNILQQYLFIRLHFYS